MKILVVGGTGLIGAEVVRVLRSREHEVTTVARSGGDHRLDIKTATVDEWRPLLAGHDGVVFATRTDEQRPLPRPIHQTFRRDMVLPAVRLFTAAHDEHLTRGVIMGSYFTHFHRLHPEWLLPERHMYIRCRLEQIAEARAAAGSELPIAVIELPFVLGPGTNWAGPLEKWARSGRRLVAPPGGTAAVSAHSVAELAAAALERRDGGDLPIADENLTWNEMLTRIASAVGQPRGVGRLPGGVVRAAMKAGAVAQAAARRESGLNLSHYADLLLAELFLEPNTGRAVDKALRETFPSA